MALDDALAVLLDDARGLKTYVCRRGPRDITGVIHLWRGGDLVAIALPDRLERDLILQVSRASAIGLNADVIGVLHEGYGVPIVGDPNDPEVQAEALRRMVNPLTGRDWAPGEMGEAVRNHQALQKGWLVEVLNVIAVDSAGNVRTAILPYRYAGRHLVLGEPLRQPSTAQADGYIIDVLVDAMNAPSIAKALPRPLTESDSAHCDVEVAEALERNLACRVVLMVSEKQQDRLRVLREAGSRLSR